MRVAVTGAAGFVGVNLVERLLGAGHEVTAMDRQAVETSGMDLGGAAGVGGGSADGRLRIVVADVMDAEQMRAAVSGAEVVFHLAAKITLKREDPQAWELNTRGVATVAQACLDESVRRLVHCSSVHSFDEHRCGQVMTESSPRSTADDLPVYDRSKYAGERELLAVVERGLDAVICNPTGIFGPKDPPGRISRLNAMVLDGALGRAPASVAGSFDLVDVRDVVDGLMLAAEHGRTGENYLMPGEMVTMHDLLTVAARTAGRRAPLVAVPLGVVKGILPMAEPIGAAFGSDVMSASAIEHLLASPCVDGGKARAGLGYAPRPFTDTVRDLVAYFVQAGILAERGRSLVRT